MEHRDDGRELSFSDLRALVTGAAGFMGSHLCEALLRGGAKVTAVVRRTSSLQRTKEYQNLRGVAGHSALQIIDTDLTSADALLKLMNDRSDIWFHLAADAYVPASLTEPLSVVDTNVRSTMNVLEAARRVKVQHVIVTSSSEVYGGGSGPLTEEAPLLPKTPYAASKAATDRLAYSYAMSFNLPVTIARPFNTYGPRHVYDAVPIFLRNALLGLPLHITGDGLQTRDLVYIQDTVAGLLALSQLAPSGEVFNIGTGADTTIDALARAVLAVTGSNSEIMYGPARDGEVRKLQASSQKLQNRTKWKPTVGLEEGLRRNAAWLREELNRAGVAASTQMDEFVQPCDH